MTWEIEAKTFCGAIRALAASDAAPDNFESYLTYHFEAWPERYARTPYQIAAELREFASIYAEV